MKCQAVSCTEEVSFTLMKKAELIESIEKTFYYAGVRCPTCDFHYRISPFYLKKKEAEDQVEAHNYRVRNC